MISAINKLDQVKFNHIQACLLKESSKLELASKFSRISKCIFILVYQKSLSSLIQALVQFIYRVRLSHMFSLAKVDYGLIYEI